MVSPRTRTRVAVALKFAVTAALLAWLTRAGALDLAALAVLVRRPVLLALDVLVFALGVVGAALRWRALLAIAGVRLPVRRALELQAIAHFFNIVVPGNVGGDLLKAHYVAREAPSERRATLLLLMIPDRLLGLTGLVLVGAIAALLQNPVATLRTPGLGPLAALALVLGGGALLGGLLLVVLARRHAAWFERHALAATTPDASGLSRLRGRLAAGALAVGARPGLLLVALALAVGANALLAALFVALASALVPEAARVPGAVAVAFPLGMLSMALPVSVAGLGVGHVAFDRLFAALGLHGGATVFNVFLAGQLTPALLGALPYLALRRREPSAP